VEDVQKEHRRVIAASIRRAIQEQSRRNELTIASSRLVAWGLMVTAAVYFWIDPNWDPRFPPAAHRGLYTGFVGFEVAVAAAVVWALRRGWYRRWIEVVAPVFDGFSAAAFFRLQSYALGDVMAEPILFGSMAIVACLLALTGAVRLRRSSVLLSTAMAFVLLAPFCIEAVATWPTKLLQLGLVAVAGTMAYWLTGIVRRSVESEVGRVTLARFLPERVVAGAHEDPLALLTEPRSLDATILISDMRGFTAWAEDREPSEVLAFLNELQGSLAEVVRSYGGTVDKFMGDGMLAVFGAPEPLADHAGQAVRVAREIIERTAQISEQTSASDTPVRVGVGVYSGRVVVGCLGSGARLEFTVLGDVVNMASRLESMTKAQNVSVLIGENTAKLAGDAVPLEFIGEAPVRGREAPVRLYTLAKP
jgi:class 3 adenylate cyclase